MKDWEMMEKFNLIELLQETRKAHAKPGGGAVVIYVANLAVNLMLMMDKKNWQDKKEQALQYRQEILEISDELTNLANNDIYHTNLLIDSFKKNEIVKDELFINAASPQIKMDKLCLRAMEILGFFLEFGKISTISDGQIANNLLSEAINSSLPTIEINLKNISHEYNIESLIEKKDKLYKNNLKIIERRTK